MSRRTDYWHDPDAPAPNTIVPGGAALIADAHGRVLMQRRADSGNWSMPGGVMDVGESLPTAVVREVLEETGFHVELTGIVGTYTDPGHVIAYSDGEVRQEFVILYAGRVIGGELRVSEESTDVRWIDADEAATLPVHESVRMRLDHWRHGNDIPWVG